MSGKFPIIDELRARRRALDLDLDEVGRRCGLDETELRDWERGADLPSSDALQRWAAALGLRLALLPIKAGAHRGIWVDWEQHHISVDGTPVRLTPMEWKVLERLAWSPGRLVTHRQLFKHLYGEERDCRAQATAVRVLINKLRRLLPIRIEAQWGHGYVIEGVPASQGGDPEDDGPKGRPEDNRQKPDAPATRSSTIIVRPAPMACNSQPLGRRLITTKQAGRRRGVALPVTDSQGRATELSVIERFLAERGVTHCPDPRTIAMSGQSELVWDKMKRKWVRSAAQEIAAPAVG